MPAPLHPSAFRKNIARGFLLVAIPELIAFLFGLIWIGEAFLLCLDGARSEVLLDIGILYAAIVSGICLLGGYFREAFNRLKRPCLFWFASTLYNFLLAGAYLVTLVICPFKWFGAGLFPTALAAAFSFAAWRNSLKTGGSGESKGGVHQLFRVSLGYLSIPMFVAALTVGAACLLNSPARAADPDDEPVLYGTGFSLFFVGGAFLNLINVWDAWKSTPWAIARWIIGIVYHLAATALIVWLAFFSGATFSAPTLTLVLVSLLFNAGLSLACLLTRNRAELTP